MGRSKRHHYVPQGLQKYFCSEDGKIWYSNRASLTEQFSKPEARNTSSAFQQRNFYTVLSSMDKPSDEVERKFYGKVDDQLGKTIAEVISFLSQGQVPQFRGQALESFKNLVLSLHRRSIDLAHKLDELKIGQSIIENTVADASENYGLNRDEVISELRLPNAKQLGRDIRVRAQTVRPDLELEALAAYQVSTIGAGGKSSFVLGSRMVYRISNGTSDSLGSKNVELWFPICPKYCLVLHALDEVASKIMTCPSRKIREVNEYIVSNCREIGSHSEKLLLSLLNRT